jgi:hypothetical protein
MRRELRGMLLGPSFYVKARRELRREGRKLSAG